MREPRKVLWRDRDAGQKLSIVMFSFCTVALTGLIALGGLQDALEGDWVALLAPVGFLVVVAGLWIDWRQRNAR